MERHDITLTGQVRRERIAPGSKSDHVGIVLYDTSGRTYVLRRADGPAFGDAILEQLAGRTISATGFVSGQYFVMDRWTVTEPNIEGE